MGQASSAAGGGQQAGAAAAAPSSQTYSQTQANGTGTAVQARKSAGTRVVLNVYEPSKPQFSMPGFGVYHTGIEIGGVEYSFAGSPDAPPNTTGVMTQQPRATPADGQWKFKESLELGEVTVSHSEFQATLRELQDAFPANQYDLIHRNCNVFTKTVAKRLGVADKYPGWVNRAASWGSAFVAPPKKLNSLDAPPPPVSVFKSTTGYKLDGSTVKPDKKAAAASAAAKPAASSSEAKKPDAAEQKRTSGATAAGGSGRKNPWAEAGFIPPSMRKDPVVATGKIDA